jgi:hypothetical protein
VRTTTLNQNNEPVQLSLANLIVRCRPAWLRTRGIRVSVVEPAYTKTQFDANFLEPDAKLDEYREVRAALGKRMTELIEEADKPAVEARAAVPVIVPARRQSRVL